MAEEPELTDYLRVISHWATPAELRRITQWASPDDLQKVLRAAGSPEELMATITSTRALIRSAERWGWLRATIAEAAKYITAVGGALVLLAAALKHFWRQ